MAFHPLPSSVFFLILFSVPFSIIFRLPYRNASARLHKSVCRNLLSRASLHRPHLTNDRRKKLGNRFIQHKPSLRIDQQPAEKLMWGNRWNGMCGTRDKGSPGKCGNLTSIIIISSYIFIGSRCKRRNRST